MGTKCRPGAYDCYDRLAPDEPYFTLMARDRYAPMLIALWAALRVMEPGADMLQIEEAKECADAMKLWRMVNRPT